jgi:hypothetical protein
VTERPIFLHVGECTLVANVHVVERMFLLCSVALVDEAHVHRGHHVGCKAEHGLLSAVLCIKTLDSNNSQNNHGNLCKVYYYYKQDTEIQHHQFGVITKSIIVHTRNSTTAK